MKALIFALIVIAAGAAYYFDALSYIVPQSQEEKVLYERARALYPSDRAAQKRWIKAETAADKAMGELAAESGDAQVKQICAQAKELYPDSPAERLDYVSAQMNALKSINAVKSNGILTGKEGAMLIDAAKAMHPKDLVKASDYAATLLDYFYRVKSFQETLPEGDFKALYNTFLKDFPKSPAEACSAFERSAGARVRFRNRNLSPELDGVREFILSQSSDSQTQDAYLDNIIRNGFSKLPPALWNRYPSANAKFGGAFDPKLKEILEKSLYFAEIGGVRRGALYVFDGKDKYFIVSSNAIKGNFSDINLSRGGENIKAKVVEISSKLPVAKLLPVDASSEPEGKALTVSAVRVGSDSFRLLGENSFGRAVTKDVTPKSSGKLFLEFYASDNIPLYSEASLVLNPENNFAIGMKFEDRGTVFHNSKLMPLSDLTRLATSSKNKLADYSAVAGAYSKLVSIPEVVPMGFAALDKTLFSMVKFDAEKAAKSLKQLEDFTEKNNLLARLISDNKFAAYCDGETAKIFPDLAKLTQSRKASIDLALKRSGNDFARAYSAWMTSVRAVLSKDFSEFRSVYFPPFLKDEVKIQEEFRKMLMEFFPARYPSADELRKSLPEDLADPFN